MWWDQNGDWYSVEAAQTDWTDGEYPEMQVYGVPGYGMPGYGVPGYGVPGYGHRRRRRRPHYPRAPYPWFMYQYPMGRRRYPRYGGYWDQTGY